MGLAWSSFASLTNSPTVITPGISMPHRRCIFTFFSVSTVHCSLMLEILSHNIFSAEIKIATSKKIRSEISRHPDATVAAAALRRGAPSYVRSSSSSAWNPHTTVNTLQATTTARLGLLGPLIPTFRISAFSKKQKYGISKSKYEIQCIFQLVRQTDCRQTK